MSGRGSAALDTAISLELRPIADLDEIGELQSVFMRIWSKEGPPPLTLDLMRAFAHSGNYVVGAFLDGRLVGGLVGFLGQLPEYGLHLHSHILGVLPDRQLQGTGYMLKQHQREWALAQGIETVIWTFDPLVRRNGFFNVCKLGADVPQYHINFYGAMGDGINGDGASDRAVAVWHLNSPRTVRAAEGAPLEPDVERLITSGVRVALREDTDGAPLVDALNGNRILCQVPADIVALRRASPQLADQWRVALRETFGRALEKGLVADGMTRSGWYMLARR